LPSFFQIRSYARYWLNAVDEHSLHSPFFFDLYTRAINSKFQISNSKLALGQAETLSYQGIEELRQKLLQDQRSIPRSTFGAGSAVVKGASPTVAEIARTSLTPAKYLAAYARMIEHLQYANIVELGTSLGISTLYLAHTPGTRVTTFEGSPQIADIARTTFTFAGSQNISLVEGNIDTTLPAWLLSARSIDLAFIDANHRLEPTLRYFNWLLPKLHRRGAIILDDIHYSREMEQAWEEVKAHKLVYATADLYKCGIAFLDPSLNRQHLVLQF
jgi:predicted O-methyltransferase YrrM